MDRINIYTFVFEDPIAPLACSLQFSPLQKHNFISTSTDFLPQIICTAWSSLLHLSSWANVALAHPRNSGTKNIYFYDFNDQLLLFNFYSYNNFIMHIVILYLACHIVLQPKNSFLRQPDNFSPIFHQIPFPLQYHMYGCTSFSLVLCLWHPLFGHHRKILLSLFQGLFLQGRMRNIVYYYCLKMMIHPDHHY